MIISLIVLLVVLGLLFWVVRALAAAFSLPPQIATVLNVVLVVVAVLWILRAFGLLSRLP